MKLVLLGDGQSPHLLKWARALAAQPDLQLFVASSRQFLPGFDACVPTQHRLAMGTRPRVSGGNAAVLLALPALANWLKRIDADWLHAHYLTSHGTLAWLARPLAGLRGRMVGSAWGSDILDTPAHSYVLRALTRRVLRACTLCTSDSHVMARRMHELGAGEIMVFPFGLESLPALPVPLEKDDKLFFANRGLEPLYEPQRVLEQFAKVALAGERLVVANEGSMRTSLERAAVAMGLQDRVVFVGRLDAEEQKAWYTKARWYLSMPRTDSVSVSVIEAMAHGCLPLLSDLPANQELVRHGTNGLLAPRGKLLQRAQLQALLPNADAIALENHRWVAQHALFGPAVTAFVARLRALS